MSNDEFNPGQQVGHLTLIKHLLPDKNHHRFWEYKCDCGTLGIISPSNLRRKVKIGHSCGCKTTKLNLTGQRYGRWIVLEIVGKAKSGGYIWKCKCDCGKIANLRTNAFRNGTSQSCGCLIAEITRNRFNLKRRDSSINKVFYMYQHSASVRGHAWDLNKSQFVAIIEQICFYCGSKPMQTDKYKVFYHNGIDRIDNNNGYLLSNSVPCCEFCNRAKLDFDKDEFLKSIKKIYLHSIKGKK